MLDTVVNIKMPALIMLINRTWIKKTGMTYIRAVIVKTLTKFEQSAWGLLAVKGYELQSCKVES